MIQMALGTGLESKAIVDIMLRPEKVPEALQTATPGAGFGTTTLKGEFITPGELSEPPWLSPTDRNPSLELSDDVEEGYEGTSKFGVGGVRNLSVAIELGVHKLFQDSSPMGRSSEATNNFSGTIFRSRTIDTFQEEGVVQRPSKKQYRKPTPFPTVMPSIVDSYDDPTKSSLSDMSSQKYRRRAHSLDDRFSYSRPYIPRRKADPSKDDTVCERPLSPRLIDFFKYPAKKYDTESTRNQTLPNVPVPDFGPDPVKQTSRTSTLKLSVQTSENINVVQPSHSRLRMSQIMDVHDIPPEITDANSSSSKSSDHEDTSFNPTYAENDEKESSVEAEKPPTFTHREVVEAATIGNEEKLLYLLDAGALANSKDSVGYFALWWAARNCHLNCVKLLLERGANIDERNQNYAESFALAHPSYNGDEEVVQFLLEAGANPAICDFKGWRAVHFASAGGHIEILKLLGHYGADLNATDFQGKTPYDVARNQNTRAFLCEELSLSIDEDMVESGGAYLEAPDGHEPSISSSMHTPPDFVITTTRYDHSAEEEPSLREPYQVDPSYQYLDAPMFDPPSFDPSQPPEPSTQYLDPPTFDPNQPDVPDDQSIDAPPYKQILELQVLKSNDEKEAACSVVNIEPISTPNKDKFINFTEALEQRLSFNTALLVFFPPLLSTILIFSNPDLDFGSFAYIFAWIFMCFIVYVALFINVRSSCQPGKQQLLFYILSMFLGLVWLCNAFFFVQMLILWSSMNDALEYIVFTCSIWSVFSFCAFGKILFQGTDP